jgi:hypothetical protein
VDVQHELRILTRSVDSRVDREARRIDHVLRRLDDIPVKIDLHQRGCCDLVEEIAVWIDQEVMLRTRHAGRDMGEDHVVPAIEGDQPVKGGKLHPGLPFFSAAPVLDAHGSQIVCHALSPVAGILDRFRAKVILSPRGNRAYSFPAQREPA